MSDSEQSKICCAGDLPLYTHEPVLGADISVAQRATHTHNYATISREDTVDVRAYGGDAYATVPYQRRYIAAWARRNLFGGSS